MNIPPKQTLMFSFGLLKRHVVNKRPLACGCFDCWMCIAGSSCIPGLIGWKHQDRDQSWHCGHAGILPKKAPRPHTMSSVQYTVSWVLTSNQTPGERQRVHPETLTGHYRERRVSILAQDWVSQCSGHRPPRTKSKHTWACKRQKSRWMSHISKISGLNV